MGSHCSHHLFSWRLQRPGLSSLYPEPHPSSPPLHPPLQLKAWWWVRRSLSFTTGLRPRPTSHPASMGVNPKQHRELQQYKSQISTWHLSSSRHPSLWGRRLGDIPPQPPAAPARGCLFPPAKANSSSDTVPLLQLVAMAHSGGDRRES